MIRAYFNYLKYERPKTLIAVWIMGAFVAVLTAFMSIPRTELGDTIGVFRLQTKIHALKNATYWHVRSLMHPEKAVEKSRFYGFVYSVDKDGYALMSVPIGSSFQEQRYLLADLRIKNIEAIRKFFEANSKVGARIELYEDLAVVYLQNEPVNLHFIESGHALPDPSPPSNIVDVAYRTYYWNIVKGVVQ